MPSAPGTSNRKKIFAAPLARFVSLNVAFLPVLLVSRISQYLYLCLAHTLPTQAQVLELQGLMQDTALWLAVSLVLLLPFFVLSLLKPWAATVFLCTAFLISVLSEWAMFLYFKIALVPLDQVVFSYSVREMAFIVRSSYDSDILTLAPFILFIGFTVLLAMFSGKLRPGKYPVIICLILFLAAAFSIKRVTPGEKEFNNPFEYYLTANKTAYLAGKFQLYYKSARGNATDSAVEGAARRYHRANPGFDFSGTCYPFLRADNTPDVLGPFFNLGEQKPNLVFIVMESLSVCFMGNHPIFGSFTPFLDSLCTKSLFWNNFLSTSDRTFNVLPALFASLPPGDPTFVNEASKIPFHLSLIRYLRENGYYTGFYYTGDPAFNYMEDFLKRQGIDFILHQADPKLREREGLAERQYWGAPDHELYAHSLRAIDSMAVSPRLDIYLTLSLHAPFIPPNREHYLSLVNERLKMRDPGSVQARDIQHYRNIFATVLYTDDALKGFFQRCKNRPDFGNTIFIITGDHGLPELNLFRFPSLARYNVPLIIYSPLLKRTAVMKSVSSHHDVTPSVLAMLRGKYNIRTRSVAAWMGSGIDTAAEFRNLHALPFILNNKEIVEYLNRSLLLNREYLFGILPGLWLKDTSDQTAQLRMNEELADFKTLNTYVTRQNKLVPPEIYFGKDIDSADIAIVGPALFSPIDENREYRPLFSRAFLAPRFSFIRVEMMIDVSTPETDAMKDPVVVVELMNKDGAKLLWHSFALPCHAEGGGGAGGEWRTLRLTEYIDLSYLQRKETGNLMLYLWNKAGCTAMFDNCRVKLTGYY